jgi:hypothetical protein
MKTTIGSRHVKLGQADAQDAWTMDFHQTLRDEKLTDDD